VDTTMQTWIVVGIVVILVVVAAFVLWRREQTRKLQQRFGPEYRHAVDTLGSETKAEAELRERERRVAQLHIVALSEADAARFGESWRALQARFVDDPAAAVVDADRLVRELMQARGYPMGDFERRAADISVDHPNVVENYRAAQAIAARAQRNEADTEQLRKAVVHYRALFSELLEVRDTERHEVRT
jgi:hypothetical protein